MAILHYRREVKGSLKSAWTKLKDVGGVHNLLSILENAQVSGDKRVCNLKAGLPVAGSLNETILSVDENLKRVAYMINSSPFGFTHHAASMQVIESNGKTEFIWITDVKPDSVPETMGAIFSQEADHIANALADNK
jgi:carbon monoxide dehydrogenase subunit G